MSRQIKGFSLIELLLVLVITISILALVSPRIVNSLDSIQLKRLSRDIAGSLRATRALAITKGSETTWLVDFDQHHYRYTNKTKNYSDKIDLTLTTASKQQISQRVATIRFFPDGSSTGGELIISQEKFNYTIQINWLTGRIKIYD